MDLVSLLHPAHALATTPGVVNQERELSLIPFPMEEIFDTKLDTFDVVIFQNFGYADPALSIASTSATSSTTCTTAARFVVIGGDTRSGEGRASFPTLDARRCRWRRAGPAEPGALQGAPHPRGPAPPGDGARQRAPPAPRRRGPSCRAIPGANLTRAKPGATVLLDHPFHDGRREERAAAGALGLRPRPRDGADDGRAAGTGPSPRTGRRAHPRTTTASGATRCAGWCATRTSPRCR